ncbi:spermidine/putrescine ABC transporter permease [Phocicoccus schoeneichii]|uniref:Spermidine/putrescine transport system permease protein PotB n=1 Tax=Phocicoccus schoeneichii TaxID=1812261 RepID=A0A6V7REU8_9BACL|nr:ABC transporter permease [Jeotgalicoccus schoeneichii]GGH50002.1 spermidine/putrescine ABC transporter permease [Jeotgalicoccus schoeneichii]CAD2075681.1 Spermidine/putrescine transport system permease protein PotB [Jeotgalicoccus schoeneichii]
MKRVLAIPYLLWMVVFVILPISFMIYYSFNDMSGNLTLQNYAEFLSSNYLKMTLNSFWYAFLITVITLLISYPLALVISRLKHKTFWLLIIIIPTWINILLKTYAFIGILGINGVVNTIFETIGLTQIQLLFSDFAFITVAVYIFIPFMVLPIFNSINGINKNLISASYDLGASKWETLTRVIFPLSLEGVKSGIQITFIPALSLFMLSRLVAGNKVVTLGTAIEQQFLINENWGMGSTVGVFLILFMVFVMLATRTKKESV